MVITLLRVTGGNNSGFAESDYLFEEPGQQHNVAVASTYAHRLRQLMAASSSRAIPGVTLTPRLYRHVAIAVAKKHLPPLAS
jgi:hypothetical protein